MHIVKPEVFLIAQTSINRDGLEGYLDLIGAQNWQSTATNDIEELIEIGGRICYNSFKIGLNPNITRIRQSNEDHLSNLIAKRHGSVLEHGVVTFALCNVSRVFTHELVRHRAGTAISQESQRYVRLRDIGIWLPSCIETSPRAREDCLSAVRKIEESYQILEQLLINNPEAMSFDEKKEITSALRRVAPEGIATNILWSANIRSLRHVIEMRTNRSAEEEIRLVFGKVGRICQEKFPNLFADYQVEIVDGLPEFKTQFPKV